MKIKLKINNNYLVLFILGTLLCTLCIGKTCMAEEEDESQVFTIDAIQFPFSWDSMTYDIQVTVSNQGEDWEGTVRVEPWYLPDIVFDMIIALPRGSTKQFIVRIPIESADDIEGIVCVSLLDKESNVVASETFREFLSTNADAHVMGILSDSYSDLTYLDMAGKEIYYNKNSLPIKLFELNQEKLDDFLWSLDFLVIDNYNTDILTNETRNSIEQWVLDGGVLILGTGKRAKEVLGGLDYLGIECVQVMEPVVNIDDEDMDTDTELSQLYLAELKDTTGSYATYQSEYISYMSSWGEGMVEIVPYALSELGKFEGVIDGLDDHVRGFLKIANDYTDIHSKNKQGRYTPLGDDYVSSRLFEIFGNGSSHLHFRRLKWVIIVYVIFVGPVLYMFLRYINKRDLYWIAVPVTTLVGICLVYLTGRGFEVANTKVYSMTLEELSDQDSDQDAWTYMRCYDGGYKEWGLRLAERYEYAGGFDIYFDYDEYHICKDGDRISFGLNPDVSFDDGYFRAGTSEKLGTGSILSDLKYSEKLGMTGYVTNGTNRDFRYFAVIMNNNWYVYEKLPAGETIRLDGMEPVYGTFYLFDSYLEYAERDNTDIDIKAALGIAICAVCGIEGTYAKVIIGVTEDWDKAVDDICSETSFGCLYTVQ